MNIQSHLFHYCLDYHIPFFYASSAAVYGSNTTFDEAATDQLPLNVYGYSKWQFDRYMLQTLTFCASGGIALL